MIRPFRCLNCTEFPNQLHFYADDKGDVACPKCKLRFAELPDCFQVLVLTHFDPPHPVAKNRGMKRRACAPAIPSALSVPDYDHAASGHAGSVTCPDCRKTEAYLKAIASLEPNDVFTTFESPVAPTTMEPETKPQPSADPAL